MHQLEKLIAVSLLAVCVASAQQPHDPKVDVLMSEAAEGVPGAQYDLALRYRDGTDVPKSLVQAYYCLNLAAAAGYPKAPSARESIAKAMIPSQVAQAQELSQAWKPMQAIETDAGRRVFASLVQQLISDGSDDFKTHPARTGLFHWTGDSEGQEHYQTERRYPNQHLCQLSIAPPIEASERISAPAAAATNGMRLSITCDVARYKTETAVRYEFDRIRQLLVDTLPGWMASSGSPEVRLVGILSLQASFSVPRAGGPNVSLLAVLNPLMLNLQGEEIHISISVYPHGSSCRDTSLCTQLLQEVNRNAGSTEPSSLQLGSTHNTNPIREEIEKAERSGAYSRLPQPDQLPMSSASIPAGMMTETIVNNTPYELRVMFAGPVDRDVSVASGMKQALTIPAGSYKVLGRVSAAEVLPFLGQQQYQAGSAYQSTFQIR